MKFSLVADYFKKIEEESSRIAMTKMLAKLLAQATPADAATICNIALGQLDPTYKAIQFNIAQELMIRVVARVMDATESSIKNSVNEQGDVGLVVGSGHWKSNQELTVHKVCQRLHTLQKTTGSGSQEEKIDQLQHLLQEVSPHEALYLVRIVLGKLRLGFSDMTLIDALSWMAVGDKTLRESLENAYNACADLGLIAQILKQYGIDAIKRIQIHVGIPIRPAAAERLPSAAAIIEKLGTCLAQPKLDGFRVQVHMDKRHKKPIVHFFSRHLKDMSAMFPDLVHAIVALDVEDIICEGEALVFDKNSGTFLPFQETVKRKRKHGIDQAAQDMPLQLFLFDILYLNGTSLLDYSHQERRKLLMKVGASSTSPAIKIIEEQVIHTVDELKEYYLTNIEAGLEGLVVKRPDAPYKAGKRNFNWIKLKREEGGHLEDTIDCVILGYYCGEGKRSTFGIGAFLVGVFNEHEDRFETLAKVGTGLKDNDWIELKKKCDALAVKKEPKNVRCNPLLAPEVWVSPELVVMIRADEITLSPSHSAGKKDSKPGYALRFPRFMGYRPDKGPQEATTVQEIEHLFHDQVQRGGAS